MIPKIIHYCWFGRGQMPELALKCIESWHKYMPDWQYKLWNEDNFDINLLPYVKEAYESRKFAFVTDVVRLYALYHEGGVYMDTDVEILKPLDDLADLTAYTGYEGSKHLPPVTGIMASQPHGLWVKEQLDYYYQPDLHFIKGYKMGNDCESESKVQACLDSAERIQSSRQSLNGSCLPVLDLTPNTQTITRIMTENGFVANGGKKQTYKDLTIFPVEYFCPRQTTGEYFKTKNTYCDHHFCGSWVDGGKQGLHLPTPLRILLIKLKRKIFG